MTTVPTTTDSGVDCVDALAAAARALLRALDGIEAETRGESDPELLAQLLCGCVHQAGLLAAVAKALRTMADARRTTGPPAAPMGEVMMDLDSMYSLLRRAALVAAPALADLRGH